MGSAFQSVTEGCVHASVWHAPADRPDVEALHLELSRMAGDCGQVIGALLVVQEGVGLSTSAARTEAVKMLSALARELGGIAIAVEGSGFGPAAVRAMFIGISLVVEPPFPWKIFTGALEAATWLGSKLDARKLPRVPKPDALVATLDPLRRERTADALVRSEMKG